MLFGVKKNPNTIRELNRKVSRYKSWWRDGKKETDSSAKRQKGPLFSKNSSVDDSFVYYEEN